MQGRSAGEFGASRPSAKLEVPAKLRPPGARRGLIDRPRLTGLVDRVSAVKVVVVRAPAGYGKTSLLVQWFQELEHRGLEPRWLSLEPVDDDPAHLVRHLAAALAPRPPALGPGRFVEQSPLAGDLTPIVDHLAAAGSFLLFLDELEHVRTPAAQRVIERLVEVLPPRSTLVVASREAPHFPLAALRVRDSLLEVELDDLRFTEGEAGSMLRDRAVDVDAGTLGDVVARTEGWAAALQLVALAVAHRDDARAFVRSLSGSKRAIADFLAEQVFQRQTEEVRRFLLRTSILGRLSAPLCTAVAEHADAQGLLEELEQNGLFLMPSDEERRWYRYHMLFAEFLRDRLGRDDGENEASLHRRAAHWYADNGFPLDAVDHAFAAGDLALAAGWVDRSAKQTLLQGELGTVVRWAERLPAASLDAHPRVREAAAWAYACLRNAAAAREQIAALRRLAATVTLDPSTNDALAAVEPVILVFEDRGPEALEASRANVPKLSGSDPFAVAGLQHTLALGRIATGDYEEARSALVLARAANDRIGSLLGSVYSVCLLGLCEAAQGRLHAAKQLYEEARELTRDVDHASPYVTMIVAAYLGEILYEQNDLEALEALLLPSFRPLTESAIGDMVASAFLTRARLFFARGADEEAKRALEDGEAYGFRTGFPRLVGLARWERVRVALAEGSIAEARAYRSQAKRVAASAEPPGYFHHASESEARDVGEIRFRIRTGEAAAVLPELRDLAHEAEAGRRGARGLRLRILEAEALDAVGERSEALRALATALDRGAVEGFVRSFADEGDAIVPLLRALEERPPAELAPASRTHLQRILAAAGGAYEADAKVTDVAAASGETLSDREREVLELVSEGLSNRMLAKRLFVSEHTVKWHLLKIFQKLGVHNRTRAVAVARSQQLIP